MTLNQVRQIIRETATVADPNTETDPRFKFEVFLQVCDKLLEDYVITKEQHKRWTNVY